MLRIRSGRPVPAKLGSRKEESSLLWNAWRTDSCIGSQRPSRSDWIDFLKYRFGYPSTRNEPSPTSMTTFPSSSVRRVGTACLARVESVPWVGWP